ncbi:MAG: insulinase family protein, partial [Nitrospira sp.]|nr:insulinase family protein [Nitrospira sp.]
RYEVPGWTGLSHLLEHMMFKGTPRYGKGEFSRIVAKNGGTENAFTSRDYTAYFENLSSDRISLSLELESDRMVNLLMDPKEFELEREVVKEERRLRTEDDPKSYLIEQMYSVAFLTHPYRFPVIGWMEDLNRLTPDDAQRHYRNYYRPNNAILVGVGDIESKALLPKIKEYFEKIPRGTDPSPPISYESAQKGERRIVVKREAQLPFVFLGYHVPNYRDPDTYPLKVLATILSTGKSSRLYHSLVYEKKIALDTGGEYDPMTADPELFYFYGMTQPGQTLEALEKGLYEVIERLKTQPISDKELQKAKNQLEAEFIFGQDSNFYQAMQIGAAETIGAGVDYLDSYVNNIRKVTPQGVMQVAKKYLHEDNRTVGILIPLKSQAQAKD